MLVNKLSYKIIVFLFNWSILAVKCEERQFRTFPGKVADIKKVPYTVFVSKGCTGALVHPQWVLTAAHCFIDSDMDSATVGLGTSDKKHSYYNISILSVHTHPKYLYNTSDLLGVRHDLALVKLAKPALLTKSIQVLKLDENKWPKRAKRKCRLVGFGRNLYNDSKLHISKFKVTQGCDCIKHKEVMCTKILKDGDDSPCFGDGGSILICNNKGVAVMSLGLPSEYCDNNKPDDLNIVFACGAKDTYFLFSSIQPHLKWYYDLVPRRSSKASRHTMKSIQHYDIIDTVRLFTLLIIFSFNSY